jgi:hypothetical protein
MAFDLGTLIYKLSLDNKEFVADLKKASVSMGAFGKKAIDVGKMLTTRLTLPIAGLGVAALLSASKLESAGRKFATAFKFAEEEASESVKNLTENFNLSNTEATKLLANTGDLFKGFGAASGKALELSNEVQELAAALAAADTQGRSVEEASRAVTAATLGETEAMKSWGVVLRQVDIDQKQLENGTSDLVGQEKLLERAQLTINLAMEQSSDAISSFADNQDTAANKTKKLVATLDDTAAAFGTILLPLVKDVIDESTNLVEWFGELSTSNKELIVTLAGIAAAAGPVSIGIGAISTAMAFLAANPIVAVAIGLAGVAAGFAVLINIRKEREIGQLADQFGELQESMDTGSNSIADFNENMRGAKKELEQLVGQASNFGELDVDELVEGVFALTDKYELTNEAMLNLIETTTGYEDALDPIIDEVREILKAEDELVESEKQAVIEAEKLANAESDITKELEDQTAAAKEKARIEQTYIESREKVLSVLESEKSEYEKIQDQIAELEATKWATGQLEEDRLRAISILSDRMAKLSTEEVQAAFEARQAEVDAEQEQADKILAIQIEAGIKSQEDGDLRALKDAERRQASIDAIVGAAMTISSLVSGIQSQALANSRALTAEFLALNEDEIDSLESKEETEEGLSDKEQKRLNELNEQKKDLAKEQYERQLEAFKTNQALSIVNTIITGAEAAINAFNSLSVIPVVGPGLGIAAAALIAGLTVKQVQLISQQVPPPPPKLAEGGLINPSVGGTHAIIGEAGSPEAVIPLNDAFFERLASAAQGSTTGSAGNSSGGGSGTQINIILDGKIIGTSTVDLINNRQLFINARSVV